MNKNGNVRNTEAHSCNKFCTGKAVSITYFQRVFVTLGIQRLMLMNNLVIRCLSGCKIFSHIIS